MSSVPDQLTGICAGLLVGNGSWGSRVYNNILINEMARTGYELTSESVRDLLSLGRPAVDWQALSTSFGVPASRVDSVSALRRAFQAALAERGPRLIEVVLP